MANLISLELTTAKRYDITLNDRVKFLASLWENDFLDSDQIHEITKVVCGNMKLLTGLEENSQIVNFIEFIDEFNFNEYLYDAENEPDPHLYETITEYINSSVFRKNIYIRGILTEEVIRNTKEIREAIYRSWFAYNGIFQMK